MPPRLVSFGGSCSASRAAAATSKQPACRPCNAHGKPHGLPLPSHGGIAATPSYARHHSHNTALRAEMFKWLDGPGKVFRHPRPGSTNYLNAYSRDGKLVRTAVKKEKDAKRARADAEGDDASAEMSNLGEAVAAEEVRGKERGLEGEDEAGPKDARGEGARVRERIPDLRPFPKNKVFRSQNVLSEELRQRIYDVVSTGESTVREASEKYRVDMRRVGAVVRLKSIEEAWKREGRPLARPYAKAVMGMLPQTRVGDLHETINDIAMHKSTREQIFWPVSESRAFTRVDAGAVFAPGLLPADQRIPHPQMVRRITDTSLPSSSTERDATLRAQMREADAAAETRARAAARLREAKTTRVPAARADFCFEDVKVTKRRVGPFVKGVGVRYGVPNQDRKKGNVKIPRVV